MPKTYVAQKLAEKWFGGPLMSGSGSTFAMDQGSILEETAIPWYEFEFSTPITRVGLTVQQIMGLPTTEWGTDSLQTARPISAVLA